MSEGEKPKSPLRQERGQISGNVTISEPVELWGSVAGTVTVLSGGKLYVRGSIYGNLVVEKGGRVHILGNISRDVIIRAKAKVVHSGTIGGNVTNHGRLFVDSYAKILGKVKTDGDGETTFDKHHDWVEERHVDPRERRRLREEEGF